MYRSVLSFLFALLVLPMGLAWAQQGAIEGQVTDAETGAPIPGVNVIVADLAEQNLGAATDTEGRYEIGGVPAGERTVEARFVGYEAQSRTIEVAAEETAVVDFALEESTIGLDEVVITATGELRSREVGTSLTRVNASDFETAAVSTPEEILAGRVSGATVLQNSGQPGAGGTIRLRGNNSITQGNRPIIYVDGIRLNSGGSIHPAARQGTSPLNDIDPNDIESIDIVKGAAATTLYGTEASGGVIRIETKRGQEGTARFNASVTGGFNNMPHVGPEEDNPTGLFVNRCRGEGLESYDGTQFEDPTCPESGSWTRNGLVQGYHLSASGGIERFNYYVSADFEDENSVIEGGGGHTSVGFRGNFGFQPLENISLTVTSSYNNSSTDWIPSGNNADSFMLNVTRGPGGNFSGADECSDSDVACVSNGEIMTMSNVTRDEHFVTSLNFNHNYGDVINNRLTLGYDFESTENEETHPFGYQRIPLGDQTIINGRQTVLSLEYVGTYETDVTSSITSTFNWGGQLYRDEGITTSMFAEEFSGPQDPTLVSGARTEVTGDTRQKVVTAGMFLQELLGWNDQLFVTLGMRIDGNSAFGEDYGLQFYPKLSTSYVISEHNFWPSWWDTMRLRAAVGESGKAPGTFDANRTWSPVSGDDGEAGFTPNQVGNPNLGPERTREIEGGFTASFFDAYVSIDATYYYQNTYEALIPVPSVPSEGFLSSQLTNVGHLRNRGVEVDLDLDVLRTSNLNWSVNLGYSNSQSEAVDLGGAENITVAFFGRTYIREGYPVPAIFGNKITNPDEVANPEYEEDTYIGPAYPETSISFGTDFRIGDHIRLNALGEMNMGGYMVNAPGYQNGRRGVWPPCYDAQRRDISELTARERARCALNETSEIVAPQYDHWIEATDFFRMRNVSVNFVLPDNWYPSAVDQVSLNLGARNLFTITDYSGTDPELDDYQGSLARRDYYADPTYRTFVGKLNVTF